jgi:hypothetical protein
MPPTKSSTIKRPVKTSKASSSKWPRASIASDVDIPKKKPKKKPANDSSEDEETPLSPAHRNETKARPKGKAKAKPKEKKRAEPVVEEIEEEEVQMVLEPEVVVEDESDKDSQVSVSFHLDNNTVLTF